MTQPAPSSLDFDKLGRYLAGEASPEEAAEVRRWLAEHPFDAKFVETLDSTKLVGTARPLDVEAALRRVKIRNRASSLLPERYMALAASAAVLLVVGAVIWATSIAGPRPAVYTTEIGERDSVVLRDGSRVLLGPASRIAARDRDVTVVGEAYFSVVHDAQRPFIVRAGSVIIRDLGTEFSVQHDTAEPIRVVVREGAVQLRRERDSVTLSPGDIGVVESNGRVRANRGAATADDLAWTQGRLVFRDASISEVATDLRRWYGVELRVTDSALLNRHFSGSFAGEPADRVLEVIALALGARVERRGNTAYIRTTPPSK